MESYAQYLADAHEIAERFNRLIERASERSTEKIMRKTVETGEPVMHRGQMFDAIQSGIALHKPSRVFILEPAYLPAIVEESEKIDTKRISLRVKAMERERERSKKLQGSALSDAANALQREAKNVNPLGPENRDLEAIRAPGSIEGPREILRKSMSFREQIAGAPITAFRDTMTAIGLHFLSEKIREYTGKESNEIGMAYGTTHVSIPERAAQNLWDLVDRTENDRKRFIHGLTFGNAIVIELDRVTKRYGAKVISLL
ncbi:MAG TPA: hypothetical protein VI874_05530 [Candidatus Norongarragalinales archaeon]|nr:hypothetical protein [Candidatus Norongarragalinales archaeon]